MGKNSYCVVELCLANCNIPDREQCPLEQTQLWLRPARKRAASSKRWLLAELLLKLRMEEKEL